ncbi:peptide deformylase [Corynebacterium mayonis]|uniref:peptide deformylase n=1 Tax=Corynebacterium mayonis TaxID=3062461 RepID=UPI0031402C5B
MAVREVKMFGDPVLSTAASPVKDFGKSLQRLVDDMLDTMDEAGGVGLAANQIGFALRVFVFDCHNLRGHVINPVWHARGEQLQTGIEGCLSVPGVRGPVTRHNDVVCTGWDALGRPLAIRGSGLLARCIQHEVDHLDGIMFMRRMESDVRKEAMAKIRAADWWKEK